MLATFIFLKQKCLLHCVPKNCWDLNADLKPYSLSSGVYAGIKFFIIDFIFKSCPKLRQRFDTPYVIWTNLPTDLQLKERSNTTLSRRVSANSPTHPGTQTHSICTFWYLFSLSTIRSASALKHQVQIKKNTQKNCFEWKWKTYIFNKPSSNSFSLFNQEGHWD